MDKWDGKSAKTIGRGEKLRGKEISQDGNTGFHFFRGKQTNLSEGKSKIIDLIEGVLIGSEEAKDNLKNQLIDYVSEISSQDDINEFTFALVSIIFSIISKKSNNPKSALIAIPNPENDSIELAIQVWSKEDASDVYTRDLSDLEKAILNKYFSK